MSEPRRMLDGEGTELEQLLLASGRRARPPRGARWKTEAMVLLAGLGFASKVQAGTSTAPKAATLGLAKYVGIVVGVSAAAMGTAHLVATSRGVTEVITVAPEVNAVPRTTNEVAVPSIPPASEAKRAEVPSVAAGGGQSERNGARASRAAATPSASIGSEIQELERARGALAAGQARAAVSALDRYQQTFPKGAMQQEALRLRIEAFALLGDRATARSLANRFETLYPNSPHAKRLHSLVDGP